MTVPSTSRIAGPFSGTGALVSYPFAFKVFAESDLKVTIADDDGLQTVGVQNSDYLVTLNLDQDASPGGSVQYAVAGIATALPVGWRLAVTGEAIDFTQDADLPQGGNYNPLTVENALDRQTMLSLTLRDRQDRTLILPATAADADTELPAPAANKIIGWNGTGTALVNRDINDFASTIVSGVAYTDIFDGTGAQTAFSLSADPGSVNALDVAISGVTQTPGVDFTVSGSALTFTSAPPLGTDNVVVRYVAAVPVGTAAADDVLFTQSGTGAVASDVGTVLRRVLHVEQFGADGVGDDQTAIANALARAAVIGAELHFDGTKTYTLDSGTLTVPANARLKTNGCTFTTTTTTTGDELLMAFGAGCVVDEVKVNIPAGKRRDRAVSFDDNCSVGRVTLTSVDVQTTPNGADGGVQVIGDNVDIGRIVVSSYDRAVTMVSTSGVRVGGMSITGYVRGLYLLDCSDLKIGKSLLATRSVNASAAAGHNGVLISCDTVGASHDITIEDFTIEDAGEHAIRIGGPERQENINIVRPIIRRPGVCGVKVLGTDSSAPTTRNGSVRIIHPYIVDACSDVAVLGYSTILLEHCDNPIVDHPIITADTLTYSGYAGIRLIATSDAQIIDPFITRSSAAGIFLDGLPTSSDNLRVNITGGRVFDCYDGLWIRNLTNAVRRFSIKGLTLDTNSRYGFNIDNGGGAFSASCLSVRVQDNVSGAGVCNTIAVLMQIDGAPGATPISGISAANSSTWSDETTLNYRKAGAWVAL